MSSSTSRQKLGMKPRRRAVAAARTAAPLTLAGGWVDIPSPPAIDVRSASKYALVVVVTGGEAERCFAASGPHMRRFAAENGYDFHVSRWPGNPAWPMSAKYGVARYLDHYDAALYADADVLFRPGCVDPMDYVGPDGFGACDELPWHRRWPKHGLEPGYAAWRRAAGHADGPSTRYFNAGVFVATKASRHLIDPPARLWVGAKGLNNHCAEQHELNARIAATGFPVTDLPRLANWQSWTCEGCTGTKVFDGAPADAILHWSGAGTGRRNRAAEMAEFARRFPWPESTWTPPADLFPAGPTRHAIDPTHLRMIRDELMSGRYGRVLEVGCWHGYSTCAFLDAYRAGQVGEVHLCEPYPQPELRRVIDYHAADQISYRVTLHERTSYDLLTADANFDLAFLDGDHGEAAVRDEAYRLAQAGCRTIFAHDVSPASHDVYGTDPGPQCLPALLGSMGYDVTVDDRQRPGERTERGLLKAVRRKPKPPPVRLSIIVATKGRDTLARTLSSIAPQLRPGDELIVECDDTGDVGATPRTAGMRKATGTHILFMDDDDVYTPGALETVRAALLADPARPHLFGMTSGAGWSLPHGGAEVRVGNVSTQMFVCPNDSPRLGVWGPRRTGDHDFITSTLAHYQAGPVWHPEVIAVWRPA